MPENVDWGFWQVILATIAIAVSLIVIALQVGQYLNDRRKNLKILGYFRSGDKDLVNSSILSPTRLEVLLDGEPVQM